jgi:SpoVK/Ycf46/Vps4 family AAA+-type ATPase
MYRSTDEQIFALVERIRQRAARVLHGDATAAPSVDPDADTEREALSLAAQVELRLPALRATFELDALATDAIVCLVAAEYDPFLRTFMRGVQRELGRPWLEIGSLAELLDLPAPRVPELARLFAPRGLFRRWALASTDEGPPESPRVSTKVKIATRVAEFLVGDDTLPDNFKLLAAPRRVLPESLLPEEPARLLVVRVKRALDRDEPLIVEITGAGGTGKRFLAEGLAAELGRSLLVVDLAAFPPIELEERLAEAQREARIAGALCCLAHWQSAYLLPPSPTTSPDAEPTTTAVRRLPTPLARLVEEPDGIVLLTGEDPEPLVDRHTSSVVHVAVPFPTPSQRAGLLEIALRANPVTVEDEVDFYAITRRFALDPGRIAAATRSAVAHANERDPATPLVTRNDLSDACRAQLRHDLKSLAVRVTNSYRWEDLVIPVDVYHGLCEMVAYMKHAQQVYDKWGMGARHSLAQGLSALFAGPPGTGKTMCASVMARELDMELFRVDLSRVVSKWIGETEKNLGKVFDEAQRSNAIILFDEADSLFAKRTEVKSSVDRYANLEVNYLLQRMEAFSGVTILTTNFEDTIDTAFQRRLTFRLRFEKPDAEARTNLWQKVFPKTCELAGDFDADKLGELYQLSGGNIRNAAVRAAFLAAEAGTLVDMACCMLAAEREAREMGLLTHEYIKEREEAADEPEADADEDAAQGDARKAVPLVPITHPRKNRNADG